MTREEVKDWLKYLQKDAHEKADGLVASDMERALGIAIEAISQPEIVRCKDCKHRSKEMYYKYDIQKPEYKVYVCQINDVAKRPDWFCADGERKESDQECRPLNPAHTAD